MKPQEVYYFILCILCFSSCLRVLQLPLSLRSSRQPLPHITYQSYLFSLIYYLMVCHVSSMYVMSFLGKHMACLIWTFSPSSCYHFNQSCYFIILYKRQAHVTEQSESFTKSESPLNFSMCNVFSIELK